jgi:hypothetical protein
MFKRLQESLSFYRRNTPGPARAVEALDRTRGNLAYRESQQRWFQWRERVEMVERWKRESTGRTR